MRYSLLFFFLLSLSLQPTFSSFPSSATQLCSHDQSAALIQFKNLFSINKNASNFCGDDIFCCQGSYPKTKSWKEDSDCCSWDGISCDNITGQVIGVDLSCSWLSGSFPSNNSIFLLPHLQRLDLSFNDFKKSKISSNFGHFPSLTHLDLSGSGFSGDVPHEISYLSKLVSLNLSSYSLIYLIEQAPEPLLKIEKSSLSEIVGNLTEVREIQLDGIDMSSVEPNSFMNLSYSLTYLTLSYCDLRGIFPEKVFNLPNLRFIRLTQNLGLTGQLPRSNWSNILEWLFLPSTSFYGELPESIGNLKSLVGLSLNGCNFSGMVPSSLGQLSQLGYLFLSSNKFFGNIPSSVTSLSKLEILDLSDNQLEGSIPDQPYPFPYLISLYLSHNLLSGTLPSWLWNHMTLKSLELANNMFTGHINEFQHSVLDTINFKNNFFHGPIPTSISRFVNLTFLDLSSNILSGTIYLEICTMKFLEILDLSHNNFNGTIPQCIGNISERLSSLNLKMNKFHGSIPSTFAKGYCGLKNLNLNGNHLEGPLTPSISSCKDLEVLDVGNNLINGTFPHWIEELSELQVLILHFNKFKGLVNAPKKPHSLSKLRIFDVSYNNFSGPLPVDYIRNFKGMMKFHEGKVVHYMGETSKSPYRSYAYSVSLVVKALGVELVKILTIFTSIDLSSNNFEGEIPLVMGGLSSLRGLNLSHNNLFGRIPPSLGKLTKLEWLDLSSNKLDGQIPKELVDLTFLSFLNVSANQLVGPIPQGKQFNTFDNDSYEGNEGLCGLPLARGCSNIIQPPPPSVKMHQHNGPKIEFGWEVVLIGYGFGFIFGAVMGYIRLLIVRFSKSKWFVS